MRIREDVIKQIRSRQGKTCRAQLMAYFNFTESISINMLFDRNDKRLTQVGALKIMAEHLKVADPLSLLDTN